MEKIVTIYSDQSKVRYIANGVTISFMVPFKFFANADGSSQLSVFTGDSDNPLTENSDYTVIGAGRDEGGEIVFTSAPEKDLEIAVIRNVPTTQEIPFKNEDKFPAVIYERSLDKLTMEVQEVKESLTRAIVLPPTSGQNPLDARNELLDARDEAVNSAREAQNSSKNAEESKKAAADSETAVLMAKADIFDNAGFQAVAADLTGDNKIGYVADNLDTVAANVAKASQAAEAAGEAAALAAEAADNAQQTIDTATNNSLLALDLNAAEKTEAFNANAAEKQQVVDAAADSAGQSAEDAALSAQAAAESKAAAGQSAAAAEESMRKVNTGWNLFDVKRSDRLQNDIRWLRGDTFSWQSGDVYTAAYEELLSEYTAAMEQGLGESDTIGGITIAFYRSPKGYKIANYTAQREADILNLYNTVGVAWYYIIDTTNRRFKLPRTKFGFTGIRSGGGNFVPETLPNIRAMAIVRQNVPAGEGSGAMYWNELTTPQAVVAAVQSTTGDTRALTLDVSRSSSVYQDGAPVQERATETYLYFWVGEFEHTAVENTAGLNAELFNDKVDLSYVNSLVNGLMSGNGLYVKRSTYTDNTTYYTTVTEWFSDAAKTQRVWMHQCGHIYPNYASSANPAVITFPKPFKESLVCANRTPVHSYTASISSAHMWIGFNKINATGFTFYRDTNVQSANYWEVYGK